MSGYSKKEVINDLYHSGLITLCAVGVSMASKKIAGKSLAAPENVKDFAKLAFAVAVSTYIVKKAQDEKYLPVDIMKTT